MWVQWVKVSGSDGPYVPYLVLYDEPLHVRDGELSNHLASIINLMSCR